jgi:hypothetical protein
MRFTVIGQLDPIATHLQKRTVINDLAADERFSQVFVIHTQ